MSAFADDETAVRHGRSGSRSRRARPVRWLAGCVATALVAGAIPAVAGATDYCVAPNQTCDDPNNVQTLEEAIDRADDATDADRIILGAAEYTASKAWGFDYIQGNSPVEIVGQGAGKTILTSQAGSSPWVLRLSAGSGSSIHDLTIRLPQSAADGFSGLHTNSAARRIEVIEDSTQGSTTRYGVDLVAGGTLTDSIITLDGQQPTAAVWLVTPDVAVRGSALSARVGARSHGGTIERSRLTGANVGLFAYGDLTAVSGSLIRTTGGSSNVIFAEPQPGSSTTVNADGVTIVGPGLQNTFGVTVGDEAAAENVSVNLSNAIIRGVIAPLFAAGSGGANQMKIAATYSDYSASGSFTTGTNASITEANISDVGDARFVDAAGGDYHLLSSSPLIDAGDPASGHGLDLDGNPLVADGNGDGSARRDLGAFELQPAAVGGSQPPPAGGPTGAADTQAPFVNGFRASPSLFAVAHARTPLAARVPRGTRFRYTLSEDARVTTTIKRALPGRRAGGRCLRPRPRLRRAKRCTRYRTAGTLKRSGTKGANAIRFTGRIGGRTLRPGRYRALITATDTAGNGSTPRTAGFRVARR